MIRVGIAGIGFMGRIHFLASQKLRGAKVAAVCSRDPAKRAGDWTHTRGNFGPEPGRVDLTGIKTYADAEEMLADPDIDLVDICTPSGLHFEQTRAALRAGKHIVCEKPIAGSLAEIDTLIEEERKAGRRCSPIFQYRFGNGFQKLLHLKRKGILGKSYLATIEPRYIPIPHVNAISPTGGVRETSTG